MFLCIQKIYWKLKFNFADKIRQNFITGGETNSDPDVN